MQGTSRHAAIGTDAIISVTMLDFIRRPSEWPNNPNFEGNRSQKFTFSNFKLNSQ